MTRVQEIYNTVFKQYNEYDWNSGKPLTDYAPVYCSADWNAWVARVEGHADDDDMVGFFDADYWIMGQDWGNLAVSDISVTSMTATTATVKLLLHNFDDVTPLRLEMVLEDGVWKIDDFIDLKYDYDWKAGMKRYLEVGDE